MMLSSNETYLKFEGNSVTFLCMESLLSKTFYPK